MKKLIFTILFTPLTCFGYGGGNLYITEYPEFDKMKPRLSIIDNEYAMKSYRDNVEDYVKKAKEYVDNADYDIRSIREAQNDAIQKANQVIEEYKSLNR